MGIESLFEPITIKNLRLPNRFVQSPMSRYSCPDQVPNEELAAYYRRRAENDVALVFTGGAAIDRPAANNSRVLADFRPAHYPAWRHCVEGVHAAGGLIGIQLWHAGGWFRIEPDYHPAPLESPSGLGAPGKRVGEPMSDEAITDVVEEFGRSAAAAKELGFDAVEIHAAHGYMIDQFFWAETNRRTDRWGGPRLADRTAFATAVIREVRDAIGPDMALSIRISQWKEQDYHARLAETPDELADWVTPLVDAGVDILSCSQRRFWIPEFEGSDLNLAGWVKKITGKPTITVGSVGLDTEVMSFFDGTVARPVSLDGLVERFERGDFDLVAIGRCLLADPEWVRKVKAGTYDQIQPFDRSKADIVY